ncbi:Ig-like domain-containing protein, partial [Massilia sp. TS11]|uniref:Ig-like domain-containing protein n=1 Tax=Massilia sp. TS11 TaxID=2908003 RepID=UPI001EDBE66B
SGLSNSDNITSTLAPTVRISLAGTGAVAGDMAELLLGGSSLAHAVTATLSSTDISNGYIDVSVTSGDLGSDGSKVLTARVTDQAGNVGTAGGSLTVTLDTTAPSAPSTALALSSASDSGLSNSDNITSTLAPTVRISLAGTSAVAGDVAELLLGGSALAHAVTATLSSTDISNGYVDVSVTSGDLGSDGNKVFTARVTDQAG